MYSWSDYINWSGVALTNKDGKTPSGSLPGPNRISTDSRTINKGDIYVPLVGQNFDGHSYIEKALAKGASAVVSEQKPSDQADSRIVCLGSGTTLGWLQKLATGYRRTFTNTKFIAITGSVGKTTVKTLLSHLLISKHTVHFAPGSYNNELGVPKTLLSCSKDVEFCVLEFGARNVDDIKFLVAIAEPDVGVCLNAVNAHLGVFGSTENLRKTKLQIIGDSAHDAAKIVLRDDEVLFSEALKLSKNIISFGNSQESCIRIVSNKWDKFGQKQTITLASEVGTSVWSFNPGHDSYAINLAASVAVLRSVGLDERQYTDATKTYIPPEGRYSVKKSATQTLINDAYNANPESMKSGLATLKKAVPDTDTLTIVLGDMLELGKTSSALHAQLGKDVADMFLHANIYFIGSESNFFGKGCPRARGLFSDLGEATPDFWTILNKSKTLYLKGSNGVGLHKIETMLEGDF